MFDSSPAQFQTLKTEINTDPRAYGYAANVTAQNWLALASQINLARATITIRRGRRTGIEVMNCIDVVDYAGRTVGQQQYIIALVTPIEGVDLSNDVVRTSLGAIFPAGNATRNRLVAAADKTPASRAEELFGIESTVSGEDCRMAVQVF